MRKCWAQAARVYVGSFRNEAYNPIGAENFSLFDSERSGQSLSRFKST